MKENGIEELKELSELIKTGEVEQSVDLVRGIIDKLDTKEIVNCMTESMRELGDRFERKQIFIPELLVASDVITELMPVIEPYMLKKKIHKKTIVLGTVEGDIHEIGKNIVSVVLKAEGYNVIDLGTDVSIDTFLQAASDEDAEIVGLSTLMTTTMFIQRDLIVRLNEMNMRSNFFIMIGGAPTSQKWADKIEADAYGQDAFSTARYLKDMQ
jgi:methylmalonyl-CoA mutase cobalamin-binding domain/chain